MLSLVVQPCLTLCHPMDYSPSGSSVHGDPPSKNIGVVAMPSSKSTMLQLNKKKAETSLVVQRLRLCASNANRIDLISGQETKNPHAMQCNQKIKKKKNSLCTREEDYKCITNFFLWEYKYALIIYLLLCFIYVYT